MNINIHLEVPHKVNPICASVTYNKNHQQKLVLFLHGFKGFKDWGAWHLVAEKFANAGFIFVRFNFSHNGIGQQNLTDFTRLDLFQQNNYSKELEDTQAILEHIETADFWKEYSIQEINIIGHSRGGGIALCSAFEQNIIKKVATWASISHFNRFGNEANRKEWQEKGFKNFYNGRTKQDMKIDFQFYTDYINNSKRLDIAHAVKNLDKPQLIIHGKADESVGFSHAQRLKNWNEHAALHLIDGANHVFGSKHPFTENKLTTHLAEAAASTIHFFT